MTNSYPNDSQNNAPEYVTPNRDGVQISMKIELLERASRELEAASASAALADVTLFNSIFETFSATENRIKSLYNDFEKADPKFFAYFQWQRSEAMAQTKVGAALRRY